MRVSSARIPATAASVAAQALLCAIDQIGSRQGILDHVRRLCAEDGLGVLWATHLIDEVHADDQVIVLHLGRIRALGDGAAICAKAEARDLRHAFTKLTTEARAA